MIDKVLVDLEKKHFQIPGFGKNLQIVHLEITRAVKDDDKLRGQFVELLQEISEWFQTGEWNDEGAIEIPDAWKRKKEV